MAALTTTPRAKAKRMTESPRNRRRMRHYNIRTLAKLYQGVAEDGSRAGVGLVSYLFATAPLRCYRHRPRGAPMVISRRSTGIALGLSLSIASLTGTAHLNANGEATRM